MTYRSSPAPSSSTPPRPVAGLRGGVGALAVDGDAAAASGAAVVVEAAAVCSAAEVVGAAHAAGGDDGSAVSSLPSGMCVLCASPSQGCAPQSCSAASALVVVVADKSTATISSIVDTGAAVSCVTPVIAALYGDPIAPLCDTCLPFRTADGKALQTTGYTSLHIRTCTGDVLMRCLVVPDLPAQLLIGYDVICSEGWCVDANRGAVLSRDGTILFRIVQPAPTSSTAATRAATRGPPPGLSNRSAHHAPVAAAAVPAARCGAAPQRWCDDPALQHRNLVSAACAQARERRELRCNQRWRFNSWRSVMDRAAAPKPLPPPRHVQPDSARCRSFTPRTVSPASTTADSVVRIAARRQRRRAARRDKRAVAAAINANSMLLSSQDDARSALQAVAAVFDPPGAPLASVDELMEQVKAVGAGMHGVLSDILADHRPLFRKGVGKVDSNIRITVQEGVTRAWAPDGGPQRLLSGTAAVLMQREMRDLVEQGVVAPVATTDSGPQRFAATMRLIKKEGKFVEVDGEMVQAMRAVFDVRALNSVAVRSAYDTSGANHKQIFEQVRDKELITVVDAVAGYHACTVAPQDQHKLRFYVNLPQCDGGGWHQYLRLPMGYCGSSSSFQQIMDQLFHDMDDVHASQDDVIIATSGGVAVHAATTREAFRRLQARGFTMGIAKTQFAVSSAELLGFHVSGGSIQAQQCKLQVVRDWPKPRTVKQLQSFIGFVNFLRQFVPACSAVTQPLTDLVKDAKGAATDWKPRAPGTRVVRWDTDLGRAAGAAFVQVKSVLCDSPLVLHHFNWCNDVPVRLYVDGSRSGMGAVLCQRVDGVWRLVECASAATSPTMRNNNRCAADLETAALLWALEHFHEQVRDRSVEICTDHASICRLRDRQLRRTRRMETCAIMTQEVDMTFSYIKAEQNGGADALSRLSASAGVEEAERDRLADAGVQEAFALLQTRADKAKPADGPCMDAAGRRVIAVQTRAMVLADATAAAAAAALGRSLPLAAAAPVPAPAPVPLPATAPSPTRVVQVPRHQLKPRHSIQHATGAAGAVAKARKAALALASASFGNATAPMAASASNDDRHEMELVLSNLLDAKAFTVSLSDEPGGDVMNASHEGVATRQKVLEPASTETPVAVPGLSLTPPANTSGASPALLQFLRVPPRRLASEVAVVQRGDLLLSPFFTKAASSTCSDFSMNDAGVLLRHGVSEHRVVVQAVVPSEWQQTILQSVHAPKQASLYNAGGVHGGVRALLYALLGRFWWPTIAVDAQICVNSCTICRLGNPELNPPCPPVLSTPVPDYAGQHIALDPKMDLQVSGGFKHYLLITDYLTRFVMAIPMISLTGQDMWDAMQEHWVPLFGPAERIRTDAGTTFSSVRWQECCERSGIVHEASASGHQQSNGMVERAIQSVHRKLCMFSVQAGGKIGWHLLLPAVVANFNRSFHSAIGMSPQRALTGHDARRALTLVHSAINLMMRESPAQVRQRAADSAAKASRRDAKAAAARTRRTCPDVIDRMFAPGTAVCVKEQGKRNKLRRPLWENGWTVLHVVVPGHTYWLEHVSRDKKGRRVLRSKEACNVKFLRRALGAAPAAVPAKSCHSTIRRVRRSSLGK